MSSGSLDSEELGCISIDNFFTISKPSVMSRFGRETCYDVNMDSMNAHKIYTANEKIIHCTNYIYVLQK